MSSPAFDHDEFLALVSQAQNDLASASVLLTERTDSGHTHAGLVLLQMAFEKMAKAGHLKGTGSYRRNHAVLQTYIAYLKRSPTEKRLYWDQIQVWDFACELERHQPAVANPSGKPGSNQQLEYPWRDAIRGGWNTPAMDLALVKFYRDPRNRIAAQLVRLCQQMIHHLHASSGS